MVKQKACKICKKIYEENKCPDCGSKETTTNFKGRIVILNPEKSELAKKINLNKKGNFAVKVK